MSRLCLSGQMRERDGACTIVREYVCVCVCVCKCVCFEDNENCSLPASQTDYG
jgi:hypothetical protein